MGHSVPCRHQQWQLAGMHDAERRFKEVSEAKMAKIAGLKEGTSVQKLNADFTAAKPVEAAWVQVFDEAGGWTDVQALTRDLGLPGSSPGDRSRPDGATLSRSAPDPQKHPHTTPEHEAREVPTLSDCIFL